MKWLRALWQRIWRRPAPQPALPSATLKAVDAIYRQIYPADSVEHLASRKTPGCFRLTRKQGYDRRIDTSPTDTSPNRDA